MREIIANNKLACAAAVTFLILIGLTTTIVARAGSAHSPSIPRMVPLMAAQIIEPPVSDAKMSRDAQAMAARIEKVVLVRMLKPHDPATAEFAQAVLGAVVKP